MSLSRTALLVATAWVACCAAAGAAGPLRPFKSGLWSGGAYTDDRTGIFTHCSAGLAEHNGTNLFILVTNEHRWWLGLIDPSWSLTPNDKTPIRLRFDRKTSYERVATIPNGQLMLVPLSDSTPMIEEFRRGSELVVDADGQSSSLKLDQIPAVMDGLVNCVRNSLSLKKPAPEPTVPAGGSSNSASAPSAKSDATDHTSPRIEPSPEGSAPSANAQSQPGKNTINPSALRSASQSNTSRPPALPSTGVQASAASPGGAKPSSAPEQPNASSATTPPAPAAQPGEVAHPANGTTPSPDLSPSGVTEPLLAARSVPDLETQAAIGPGAISEPHPATPSSTAGAHSQGSLPASSPQAPSEQPPANPQTAAAPAGAPPLGFTAVGPAVPTEPSVAIGPAPAGAAAFEEIQLATDFVAKARFADARLVNYDKPAALADFAAVWRSDDAAGAVKIIPAGPKVTAIGIASDLITIDPQICGGDFSSARFRTDIDGSVAFSAVLTCGASGERRITEYYVVPRPRGGFAVFAVIRSTAPGILDFDRQKIDRLARIAIETAGGRS